MQAPDAIMRAVDYTGPEQSRIPEMAFERRQKEDTCYISTLLVRTAYPR
jgi:hypothetical protein